MKEDFVTASWSNHFQLLERSFISFTKVVFQFAQLTEAFLGLIQLCGWKRSSIASRKNFSKIHRGSITSFSKNDSRALWKQLFQIHEESPSMKKDFYAFSRMLPRGSIISFTKKAFLASWEKLYEGRFFSVMKKAFPTFYRSFFWFSKVASSFKKEAFNSFTKQDFITFGIKSFLSFSNQVFPAFWQDHSRKKFT